MTAVRSDSCHSEATITSKHHIKNRMKTNWPGAVTDWNIQFLFPSPCQQHEWVGSWQTNQVALFLCTFWCYGTTYF